MKKVLSLVAALAVLAFLSAIGTETVHAQSTDKQFGKAAGLHWGPFDDDGDGIPNGQDPDYVRPKNCTGRQFGTMQGGAGMMMNGKGKGYGPGNGSGNQGIGPRDGSGFGPGTGICDGTGPKGRGGRGR